ncbi:MAG: hypothetical protein V1760_01415, partial [Candidatus Peregrinibacteria bacterium]
MSDFVSEIGRSGGSDSSRRETPKSRRESAPPERPATSPAKEAEPAEKRGSETAKPAERREAVRSGVESKLSKEALKYLGAIREALENEEKLKSLREFVQKHPVFDKSQDKFRQWGIDFCTT